MQTHIYTKSFNNLALIKAKTFLESKEILPEASNSDKNLFDQKVKRA